MFQQFLIYSYCFILFGKSSPLVPLHVVYTAKYFVICLSRRGQFTDKLAIKTQYQLPFIHFLTLNYLENGFLVRWPVLKLSFHILQTRLICWCGLITCHSSCIVWFVLISIINGRESVERPTLYSSPSIFSI